MTKKKMEDKLWKKIQDLTTENKKLKDELSFLQMNAAYTQDVVSIHSAELKTLYVGPTITSQLGYTVNEFVEKSLDEMILKEDFPGLIESLHRDTQIKLGYSSYLFRLLHKDGRIRYARSKVHRIFNKQEKLMYYVVSSSNVEELHDMEQQIIEGEEKLKATINSLDDLVFVMDTSGRFQEFYSPRKAELLYLSPSDFLGKHFTEIGYPKDLEDKFKLAVRNVVLTKEVQEFEYSLPVEVGVKWFNAKISYRYGVKDKYAGMILVVREISAQKKLEEELKKVNAAKEKLYSIIAHDLKDPFNTILGFSGLLKDEIMEVPREQLGVYADIVNQTSRKAFDLLMNLLDWTTNQNNQITFQPRMLDLCSITDEVLQLLKVNANEKDINIELQVEKESVIYADRKMLQTILRNLVGNALKYSNPSGRVEIRSLQTPDENIIQVKDYGAGMSEEQRAKLFNVETTISTKGTMKESGTGLGLLLCRDFAQKHGGNIQVESKKGLGTVVSVKLPKAKD